MRPALLTSPGLAQVRIAAKTNREPSTRAYIRACMSGDIQQEPT
jgi:hypothetical protein